MIIKFLAQYTFMDSLHISLFHSRLKDIQKLYAPCLNEMAPKFNPDVLVSSDNLLPLSLPLYIANHMSDCFKTQRAGS